MLVVCGLFSRTKKKYGENSILLLLQFKAAGFKGKPINELNALPVYSEETVTWYEISVQLQTQCKKLEDGNFQLILSAKFKEEGDTITYMREFVAPNQLEKQT